mgnify:CR=1 FL=1
MSKSPTSPQNGRANGRSVSIPSAVAPPGSITAKATAKPMVPALDLKRVKAEIQS